MAKRKKHRNPTKYFSTHSSHNYVTSVTSFADSKDIHCAATQIFGSTYYVDYDSLTSS